MELRLISTEASIDRGEVPKEVLTEDERTYFFKIRNSNICLNHRKPGFIAIESEIDMKSKNHQLWKSLMTFTLTLL